MPITVQKRRYPKQQTKAISNEKQYNGSGESFLSKISNRIPAALILLFLVFIWSSSTTFISGSIFHVCVTSRKLNEHLYCVSAGAQPSNNLDIPQPISNVEPPPGVPISGVFRTPLSSLSNSATESVTITKHVKQPSTTIAIQKKAVDDVATRRPLSPIIQLPVANNRNTEHSSGGGSEDGHKKTDLPFVVQSPQENGGVKSKNIDIPQPIANVEPPPGVPISGVFRTPLSSLRNSAMESVTITNHVKQPSTVAIQKKTVEVATHKPLSPIIQLPVANNSNTEHSSGGRREDGHKKTDLPLVVQSPQENRGVKSKNLAKEITLAPGTETESAKKPASITIREKIDDKTAKKKDLPFVESTSTPAPVTIMKKMENKTKVEEEIELGKIEAEEQMEVLRSYKIGKPVNYSDPEACDGKRIFVYNLPSKFNKDLLGHCSEMITWLGFCKFLSNNAFGEPVQQLGDGWYNTHQYALEPIFHARILNHPCRVYNPEEAKVFYVPYYGGLDILRWHFKKNITLQMKDKLSYELIDWLSQQAPWKKKFGLDHLFVLGKISWDFRRMKNFTWGTHFLDMDEMQSPMKLLIERHPWHINDIGVPHPSFFHPRSDNDIFAWQKKLIQMPRKNLVSFAGAPRPKAKASIRSILIEQCTSAPDKCRFFDCRQGRCTQPGPMVELFTESEFCLQPVGDSATRKSVFDSLVSGCIPVLFSPFTAYYQYPWHLSADRSNYSVFVDQEDVRRRQVNVVDRLVAIPAARRAEMRRYIVYELLPGLVYADPKGKLEKFEDAFTVAMNSVLERMSRLP